jgi:hypothetical protein
MNKNSFRKEEVIAFLECRISENAASDEQEELLQNYMWSGKLNKNTCTYKETVKEMMMLWNERY